MNEDVEEFDNGDMNRYDDKIRNAFFHRSLAARKHTKTAVELSNPLAEGRTMLMVAVGEKLGKAHKCAENKRYSASRFFGTVIAFCCRGSYLRRLAVLMHAAVPRQTETWRAPHLEASLCLRS